MADNAAAPLGLTFQSSSSRLSAEGRIVPTRSTGSFAVLLGAVGALAAACSGCGPTTFYVREMKIDPAQHLIPVGRKSLHHPAADSYYMFFHTATGLTIVDHLAKQRQGADARRLLYLETDHDQVLERTVKTDEIVTGPYGAIVADKTCFYNRPANYRSDIEVLVESLTPDVGREVPAPSVEEPLKVPLLTSVSVVRFFREDSYLTFASANYEANGTPGSIQSGRIVNGDLQPGSSVASPAAREFDKVRQDSGLPRQFDIGNYLNSKRLPNLKTLHPQENTTVVLIYGFGKLIRQDSLRDGLVISSRYMSPVVTEEERALTPRCDDSLREQVSRGEPTVFPARAGSSRARAIPRQWDWRRKPWASARGNAPPQKPALRPGPARSYLSWTPPSSPLR